MLTRLFVPAVLLVLAAPALRGADEKPAIKIAEGIEQKSSGDKDLPHRFNGRTFVVAVNRKVPKGAALEKAILKALGQDKKAVEQVLYHPFGDDEPPTPVEVKIGSKVPLAVIRTVLTELAATDLKLALGVCDDDEGFGNTQRLYVGGYLASGKKAIAPDKLKELLDPKLTQKELLEKIGALK